MDVVVTLLSAKNADYAKDVVANAMIMMIRSKVINNSLINEYNLMFTLLSPGIRQVLLVLAVSIGVAFISTFIPVYNIAMKRPIDAIRDR